MRVHSITLHEIVVCPIRACARCFYGPDCRQKGVDFDVKTALALSQKGHLEVPDQVFCTFWCETDIWVLARVEVLSGISGLSPGGCFGPFVQYG